MFPFKSKLYSAYSLFNVDIHIIVVSNIIVDMHTYMLPKPCRRRASLTVWENKSGIFKTPITDIGRAQNMPGSRVKERVEVDSIGNYG